MTALLIAWLLIGVISTAGFTIELAVSYGTKKIMSELSDGATLIRFLLLILLCAACGPISYFTAMRSKQSKANKELYDAR